MKTSDDRPLDETATSDRMDGSSAGARPGVATDGEPADAPTDAADATGAEPAGGEDDDAPRRELAAQQDRYLRLAAEYDNFRRRTTRERAEAGTRAQAELVKSLLETLDDLDRFAQVDPGTATAGSVIEAVGMVARKLGKVLSAAGLEVVSPAGQPFDPALHEAIATEPAASPDEDSTVAQVYQLGYVFGGQLLRPARVVVRQWNG